MKKQQYHGNLHDSLCGQTGVEMEAMTGVSVALLTIYDMCKALDRGMEIGQIHLLENQVARADTTLLFTTNNVTGNDYSSFKMLRS